MESRENQIIRNVEVLLNSKLHGNALRKEIERIFQTFGVEFYKIIRTKRGYLIYVREGERNEDSR